MAAGAQWLGKHEIGGKGPVVYFAAEGHIGMKVRISSWLQHAGIDPDDVGYFRLVGEPLALRSLDDVRALIAQLEETFGEEPISLIVLDTLQRCTEGLDENSSKEMGLAVQAADMLKRETGSTVLLVHHTGYASDHARGSTVVKAALDTQVRLKGSREALTLYCDKQKDSEPFKSIPVALLRVDDSLVAVSDRADSPARRQLALQSLTPNEEQALEALRIAPDGLGATAWEKASGLKRSSFYKARTALLAKRLARLVKGTYSAAMDSPAAPSEEVHESTPPLGGGLVDSEPSDRIEDAIEDSRHD